MFRTTLCLVLGFCLALAAIAAPPPLQTFTVKDYLQHQWTDELLHFPIAYTGNAPKSLMLTDADGKPMPCQITGLTRKNGKVTGTVWTVASLSPKGTATFHLQPGKPAPTALRLQAAGKEYLLGNECLTLRLPKFSGALAQPVDLVTVPAPLLAISGPDGKSWLGQGSWTNADQALQVKAATTTVVEEGPVRVTVRYRLTFTDDRFYQADITLGARQDAALFTDETDVEAPKAAFRFSFQSGLAADRVYWRNNYYAAQTKGLKPEPINFDKEQVLTKICPWSFWWLTDQTTWAGFYQEGAQPLVGVMTMRPSRWMPIDWNGFARTVIPVTARPGGQLDITLGLLAWTRKQADGTTKFTPAHRELAFTVGTVAEHVTQERTKIKLRRQHLKYGEFPLDEVKDFHFNFKRAASDRKHPYLLFTQADIDRARRQAKTVPMMKADLAKATKYMASLGCDPVAKIRQGPDGPKKFFEENYVGNGLYEVAPQAYVGSDDPKYGLILATGLKGMTNQIMGQFLETPYHPSLGGNGHMSSTTMLRVLMAYDALADSEYLTAEDKGNIEAALVFSGYVFNHPDYWNTDVGLCSANPNMTSLLKLPLGLLGLYLDGHPQSDHWLKFAEAELQEELKDWISPGGAWLECPMYQAPSLDGMFLLSQAIKNVKGKDYFADPNFKATMDYYGFILTPPDHRFPPTKTAGIAAPMTIPSIGDAFPVFTHPFNGWMARETAKSDPAYSARQQAYWQGQSFSFLNSGRSSAGFIMAICDPGLPAAPPAELARRFEGFGNILRTSWTDPKATYVAHRNGYYTHHYDPGDGNSILLHAKGVPLCVDFGHRGATYDEVITMWRPDYHSTVSFDRPAPHRHWGMNGGPLELNKQAQEVRTLPQTIDYSTGLSYGSGNQRNNRHLLLVKSADQLGANYLVVRDMTTDGQPNQEFTWNLWCMAKEPEIAGNVAHFPGLFGVDLDAHVLSPANPQFVKDQFKYKQWVNPWGFFEEEQTGVHVHKVGSTQDFFSVLYPRAAGQGAATVTALADGRAVKVAHMEGTDIVLLSPGKTASVTDGDVQLAGEIAFARKYQDGALRLAVLRGLCAVKIGDWLLSSNEPVSIEVKGKQVTGESSGEAHAVQITLPPASGTAVVTLDGKPVKVKQAQNLLTLDLPAGAHAFTITIP
ncbi:MAG: hypothetical protein ACYDBB_11185 [Armatimonadota bacterium]